jgi:hypothetical protein
VQARRLALQARGAQVGKLAVELVPSRVHPLVRARDEGLGDERFHEVFPRGIRRPGTIRRLVGRVSTCNEKNCSERRGDAQKEIHGMT